MFKYLKMIAFLKDIRKEVQAEGTLKNIALSRKFWGALWLLGGYILREFLGVDLDQATIDQGTDLAVLIASYCMQGFGIAMQLVSYVKTIKNAIGKKNGKQTNNPEMGVEE